MREDPSAGELLHELNNALTVLGGFVDILRHGTNDDDRAWALERLDEAVTTTFTQVRQLTEHHRARI